MAWLQDLAGKAENLLNKIDQNAATVLSDPTIKQISLQMEEEPQTPPPIPAETTEEKEQDAVLVADEKEGSPPITTIFERTFKSEYSSSSLNTSEEIQRYEAKIAELEQQNQQYSSQVLNLQHLYCEIKNENYILNDQLLRTNESIAATNAEMEQYKIRAQRVLQEKEKLISYKQKNVGADDVESDNAMLANYLEEIKKELKFQQEKNDELNIKIQNTSSELSAMQQQFFEANKIHQEAIQELEDALTKQRKMYLDTEEELRLKHQEVQNLMFQLVQQSQILRAKEEDLEQAKEQLRQNQRHSSTEDLENRLHSLTETLMAKQSSLETVTTERNALRLQMEKLENEYHKLMSKTPPKTTIKIETISDTDEVKSQVPQFMRVSPMDVGMTRRVKRAYGTLDAISIRAGVFLRRYPLARVFVFSYCVLLHFWVLIILFTYVPTVR